MLVALLAAVSMTAAASGEIPIEHRGAARSYLIHLPNDREPAAPAALVVVLHGLGADASTAPRMSGMDAKADREGFIALYPNGRSLSWNAWRCCGAAEVKQFDDVGFIRAVVEKVAREHAVDRKRIYATGISNGAMMAYRLGCEAADVFAAIAPVAGAMLTNDCRPSTALSVVVFHGMADDVVPFQTSVVLVQALVKAHKRFEFAFTPTATHAWAAREDDALYLYGRLVDFFERWIPPGPRDAPPPADRQTTH